MQSAAPADSSRSARRLSIDWQEVAFQAAMPILAMLAALLIGVVERDQATVEQIGLMMAGISMSEAMQRFA
jgi:hypothetical protein